MSLNRREILRLGAVGVGGVMLSSAASSVGLPSVVFQAPRSPLPQPIPVAPRAPFGVDQRIFERAKAALDAHRIYHRDFMGIADFSLPSSEPKDPLGACASEAQSMPEVHHRSPQPVAVSRSLAANDPCDLARERGGHTLVGVDREDPGPRRHLERRLLLAAKIVKGAHRHARASLRGDRHRRIGRAIVEHDDLVGELANARETRSEMRFLVVHYENDRKPGGHVSRSGIRLWTALRAQ